MAGDFDFLKDLGFSPDDFKGLSRTDAADLIEKRVKEKKKVFLEESKKDLFENAKTKFPELKAKLDNPFRVYVKPLAASTKPSSVIVVGYIPKTKEIIVYNGAKIIRVSENDLIKNDKEYEGAIKKKTK
jgi:hypothetical protein